MAATDVGATGQAPIKSAGRNRIPSLAGFVVEGTRETQKAANLGYERDALKKENEQLKADLETARTAAPAGKSLEQIEADRVAKQDAKDAEAAKVEEQKKAEEDRKAEDQRRRRLAGAGILTSPSGVVEPARLAKASILGY